MKCQHCGKPIFQGTWNRTGKFSMSTETMTQPAQSYIKTKVARSPSVAADFVTPVLECLFCGVFAFASSAAYFGLTVHSSVGVGLTVTAATWAYRKSIYDKIFMHTEQVFTQPEPAEPVAEQPQDPPMVIEYTEQRPNHTKTQFWHVPGHLVEPLKAVAVAVGNGRPFSSNELARGNGRVITQNEWGQIKDMMLGRGHCYKQGNNYILNGGGRVFLRGVRDGR